MKVWVGTSGYSYADWVGPFYPAGLRPNQMLRYYAGHFPIVELNFTFYRCPSRAMLARLAEATPPGFPFVVKLPRSLSHEENASELAAFRDAVQELRGRGRLQGLLCQLPQSSHHDRRRMQWLDRLAGQLADYRLAVEFRHRSWHSPGVGDWLRQRGLDLVSVDVPDIAALYPRGLVQSGPRLYVRFHSRNAANWYLSDKDRYDYHYGDDALREWVGALAGAAGRAKEAVVFLNNCHGAQAAENARRLRQLLIEGAPGLEIVDPVAPPPLECRQRTLFD